MGIVPPSGPFDDLRRAVDEWRDAQAQTRELREHVVTLVQLLVQEGVPVAVVARAAGITHKEARTMVREV